MSERYVRPTVGGWLAPTLLAPWVSTYGVVTAVAVLGIDRGLFGKSVAWAMGMAVGSAWALSFCLLLVLVDVLLLGVKVRTLPVGGRGWLASLLSPLAVFATYVAVPPYSFWRSGPWAVAAAVAAPMIAVALVTRVVSGRKPPR